MKELSNRHKNALKNTFPEVVEKWDKKLNISDKPNGQEIAELMESEASKLLKEEFNQLEELNEYLRLLADMDNIGIRRKLFLLEGYMNKVIIQLKNK
jgi:molecular chaperone GrpE (heat shock protein)